MKKLAEDIAWHERQILMIKDALKDVLAADSSEPQAEVEALKALLARHERTMQHLMELTTRRNPD